MSVLFQPQLRGSFSISYQPGCEGTPAEYVGRALHLLKVERTALKLALLGILKIFHSGFGSRRSHLPWMYRGLPRTVDLLK